MFGVSGSTWHCFYPLGHIIDGNKDVFAILGLLEWSHEVNALHIKYFYLKVIVEGHCIVSGDVSLKLTISTPPGELLGVLIHR
jgi:hypothetical protein